MNTHPAEDEAPSLWRGQGLTPLQPLPPEELARQAHQLQDTVARRNRREVLASALITPVFLFYAWYFPHWLTKLGALLTVAGTGVVMWQLHRRARARPLPEALAGSLMEFHRAELARQRDALRSVWRWYIGPLVPGLVLFLCGRQIEKTAAGSPPHSRSLRCCWPAWWCSTCMRRAGCSARSTSSTNLPGRENDEAPAPRHAAVPTHFATGRRQ
jgi:hypothetical protein